MRTFTCCQTGREKTGAKTPMALLKAIGKESMAVLSVEANTGCHCRSILTQIVINGQSRAKDLFKKVENASAVYTSELDHSAGGADPEVLVQDRLKKGRERLDNALETLALPWEPVAP